MGKEKIHGRGNPGRIRLLIMSSESEIERDLPCEACLGTGGLEMNGGQSLSNEYIECEVCSGDGIFQEDNQFVTLYQIVKTKEMIEFLNSEDGGWENASKKYPAWEAYRALQMTPMDSWKPEYFQHFTAVAKIKTQGLSEAYAIGNAYGGAHTDMVKQGQLVPLIEWITVNGRRTPNMRSMSVGDIVQRNDEYFMCEEFGFARVDINESMEV